MRRANSRQGRAERLIAVGRVVLAVLSLFAVWLNPSEPTRYAATAYGLLIAYVAYSVAIAALVASRGALAGPAVAAIHALDLLVAALVMFFTESSASPFFIFFVGGQWLEKESVGQALEKFLRREANSREIAVVLTPKEGKIYPLGNGCVFRARIDSRAKPKLREDRQVIA